MAELPRHYRGMEAAVLPANPMPFTTHPYGPHPAQACDLRVPDATTGVLGVVILVHGGAWHAPWDREQFNAVASHVTRRGYVTWNIDYRGIGDGGGYPETLVDVARAVDALGDIAAEHAWNLDNLVIIGHSAGGQLGFWAAARNRLPPSAPGSAPRVVPRVAVSLAGLLDLEGAAWQSIAGWVAAFMGGTPLERPERYPTTSPLELVPLSIPQLIVQGTGDTAVPREQADEYVAAARAAGDDVTLLTPQVDHFAYLWADAPVWNDILDWMASHAGQSA